MKLDLQYVAGCIDCDGSINLAAERRFSPVVNFRQLELYRDVVEDIKDTLGVGKIYDHSGSNLRMLTWQTVTHLEALEACQRLLPYLRIKKRAAELMIEACELWESTKGKPRGAGFEHPDWVKERVLEISRTMNPSNQKSTSRRNKDLREVSCTVPPEGWYCTRDKGHDGPCAAVPIID